MQIRGSLLGTGTVMGLSLTALLLVPRIASPHCDTLDGPVVKTARVALEKGEVTPVLKWIRKEDEPEIRAAFAKTLAVRGKGPEAKDLADTYFFETLVRVHRAGEGAAYTGLKPAGTDLGPAVAGADKALESGSVEDLVRLVTDEVAKGIRERFARATEAKRRAEESIESGREFVEAYVTFVHYVERMDLDATTAGEHDGGADGSGTQGHHGH